MPDLFYYLSPLIIPILPKAAGATVISLNLANALRDIADDDDNVIVTFNVQTFEGGKRIGEEKFDVRARGKNPDMIHFERRYVGDGLGYTVRITSNRPYFRKLFTEHFTPS